jgi:hypothetical protein
MFSEGWSMPVISALRRHRQDSDFQAKLDKVSKTLISKPKYQNLPGLGTCVIWLSVTQGSIPGMGTGGESNFPSLSHMATPCFNSLFMPVNREDSRESGTERDLASV